MGVMKNKCEMCNASFDSWSELESHNRATHPEAMGEEAAKKAKARA
ncbi:hypothetical protein HYU18_00270 [Candidatus Woesearchaeota archaeon]|nr:hypothetical protein [Candidatus Woesearchaeota archaeon]